MAVADINDQKKWEVFVRRLLEKTCEGVVEWNDWSDKVSRSNSQSPFFVAQYKHWRILVYRYAYRHFLDDEHFDWEEDVAIELVDDSGMPGWKLPKVPSRYSLLDHIEYEHADVESLYSDIVGDEQDP